MSSLPSLYMYITTRRIKYTAQRMTAQDSWDTCKHFKCSTDPFLKRQVAVWHISNSYLRKYFKALQKSSEMFVSKSKLWKCRIMNLSICLFFACPKFKYKPSQMPPLTALPTYMDKVDTMSEMYREQWAAAESTPSCSDLIIWIQQGNHFQIPDDYAAKKHRSILIQINSLVCLSEPLSSSFHSAAQLQEQPYHLFGNNSPNICKNLRTPSPLGTLVIKHCTLEKVLEVTSDGYLVHQSAAIKNGYTYKRTWDNSRCTTRSLSLHEISIIVFLLQSES